MTSTESERGSSFDLEVLKSEWLKTQDEYIARTVEGDDDDHEEDLLSGTKLFGGLDISFIVGDDVNACAGYVVVDASDAQKLRVVYQDLQMVQMTAPYIPGFLAFREADCLIELVNKQRRLRPELTPGVLMVDGNGILHPRWVVFQRDSKSKIFLKLLCFIYFTDEHKCNDISIWCRCCGVACHIGLDTGLPTIGVAKNLHQIQEFGPQFNRDNVRERFEQLSCPGEYIELATDKVRTKGKLSSLLSRTPLMATAVSHLQGRVLGAAMKTSSESHNPVYVSVGSGLRLTTATTLVARVCRVRIPEPTRQADILTREFLRLNHPTDRQKQPKKQM